MLYTPCLYITNVQWSTTKDEFLNILIFLDTIRVQIYAQINAQGMWELSREFKIRLLLWAGAVYIYTQSILSLFHEANQIYINHLHWRI